MMNFKIIYTISGSRTIRINQQKQFVTQKLIWLLDISVLKKIPKKYLTQKIVVCNIYKNEQFIDNKYVDYYFNFSDINLDTKTSDKCQSRF